MGSAGGNVASTKQAESTAANLRELGQKFKCVLDVNRTGIGGNAS